MSAKRSRPQLAPQKLINLLLFSTQARIIKVVINLPWNLSIIPSLPHQSLLLSSAMTNSSHFPPCPRLFLLPLPLYTSHLFLRSIGRLILQRAVIRLAASLVHTHGVFSIRLETFVNHRQLFRRLEKGEQQRHIRCPQHQHEKHPHEQVVVKGREKKI